MTGVVQDASGARVPAASIVVHETGTTNSRAIKADREGAFRVDDLLPGGYEIVVTSSGFAEARARVDIAVSSTRIVSVTLQPAAVNEAVRVSGAASSITTQPLDVTTAVHQGVVTLNDLNTIPLAHRSFANIAYLVPGTEAVEPSDPTKARITAASFGGSSVSTSKPRSTAVTIPMTASVDSSRTTHPTPSRNSRSAPRRKAPIPVGPREDLSSLRLGAAPTSGTPISHSTGAPRR